METLQEINDPKIIVVNDENSDNIKKPTFLEEQIRDYIPIDGEENETV